MTSPIHLQPPPTIRTNVVDVSRIPNEIFARIFYAGTTAWRDERPDQLPFPILVSTVCLHWKLLAFNTPELWSFIVPPLHLLKTSQSSQHWTSQWLSRSGALAATIVIDDRLRSAKGNHTVQDSQAVVLGVLNGIVGHVHRLRRLDIWSRHIFPNDLHPLFQGQEPIRLRQLSLCSGRITQSQIIPNSSPQTAVMFSWLERLPRMHKLRVAGAIFPVVSPLTHLCVHSLCVRYSEIQTIFSTCHHLKCLVLPDLLPIALPHTPSEASTIVTATSLKSIAISLKPVSYLDKTYLVRILEVPNLEYLEINGDVDISSTFNTSLVSSKIRTLRLSNRSRALNKDDQTLLRSFNFLQSLRLMEACTDGIFDHARPPSQPTVTRKRSISSIFSFNSSSSSSVSATTTTQDDYWPQLREITLSSIFTDDVMRLCRYVQLRKRKATIWLSKHAMRHLSESLVRDQDGNIHLKDATWRRKGMRYKGIEDVEEWLSRTTDIKIFKTCSGLLDCEHFPLQEL